jgi:hypothetical protein
MPTPYINDDLDDRIHRFLARKAHQYPQLGLPDSRTPPK